MIVSILQINCLTRYYINHGHLEFLGYGYHIYCCDNYLIQVQILLTPIFKTRQETPLTIDSLHQTSELLTCPPVKYLHNLILQPTYP